MKRQGTMQAHQLETFVRFLEEHPGFSPLLTGEDALVCGFQVSGSFLRIDEMERIIAIRRSSMRKRQQCFWLRRACSERAGCEEAANDELYTGIMAPDFTKTLTVRYPTQASLVWVGIGR